MLITGTLSTPSWRMQASTGSRSSTKSAAALVVGPTTSISSALVDRRLPAHVRILRSTLTGMVFTVLKLCIRWLLSHFLMGPPVILHLTTCCASNRSPVENLWIHSMITPDQFLLGLWSDSFTLQIFSVYLSSVLFLSFLITFEGVYKHYISLLININIFLSTIN